MIESRFDVLPHQELRAYVLQNGDDEATESYLLIVL
jgi:hypothetical protein